MPRSSASLMRPTRPPRTSSPPTSTSSNSSPSRCSNIETLDGHAGRRNRPHRQIHPAAARPAGRAAARRSRRHASARSPRQTRPAETPRPRQPRAGSSVGQSDPGSAGILAGVFQIGLDEDAGSVATRRQGCRCSEERFRGSALSLSFRVSRQEPPNAIEHPANPIRQTGPGSLAYRHDYCAFVAGGEFRAAGQRNRTGQPLRRRLAAPGHHGRPFCAEHLVRAGGGAARFGR